MEAATASGGEEHGQALRTEMVEAAHRFNLADDDTLVLQMDYLEPVISKMT